MKFINDIKELQETASKVVTHPLNWKAKRLNHLDVLTAEFLFNQLDRVSKEAGLNGYTEKQRSKYLHRDILIPDYRLFMIVSNDLADQLV